MNRPVQLPDDWDDNPEWTVEDFARARPLEEVLPPEMVALLVKPTARPPRPIAAKQQVSLRLDRDILDRFRADGPGWQTRINEALRKSLG